MNTAPRSPVGILFLLVLVGCFPSDPPPSDPARSGSGPSQAAASAPTDPVRLAARFDADLLSGDALAPTPPPRTEWSFASDLQGWQAGPGIADLRVEGGRLRGRTTGESALIHVELRSELAPSDPVHDVEVRGRVSEGSKMSARFQSEIAPGLAKARRGVSTPNWGATTDIEPGGELRTWRLGRAVFSTPTAATARHLILHPTGASGATFEIESIRVIFESEHLAGMASGRGWHGLDNVFHDSLLLRAGQAATFELVVPRAASLELELGTPHHDPVAFRADLVAEGGGATPVVRRTITTPNRWERITADLSRWEGERVELTLSIAPESPHALGFFANPIVRPRHDPADPRPQGVVLFLGDTLRRHHLAAYGYERETAPQLTRLARDGALFLDPISQGSWTKVSTPSILTGLYQSSHGVTGFDDRLSEQATTLAEIFQDAGYATLAYSSVPFTGRFSNMHQGYDTLHESTSVRADSGVDIKTARTYVDRFTEWLDDRPETPFFVFLQAMDPHDPFEPRSPWNRLWADPARMEAQRDETERARPHIAHGFMRSRGLANPEELREAGVDPEAHYATQRDWYDGSIRGMDAELSRLIERLDSLGIADDVLFVFVSDHGEEFGEHGEIFHGQSLYAEMLEVPLVFWGSGISPGVRVEQTVRAVDILPTVLELVGIPAPGEVQGRSLVPAMRGEALPPEPAFAEKWLRGSDDPAVRRQGVESIAVIDESWKLIHNSKRTEGVPEFELYDRANDPGETKNLADANPDQVGRLRDELDAWKRRVASIRYDAEQDVEGATEEELEQLRALGYVE